MVVRFLLPILWLAAACTNDSDPEGGGAINLAVIKRGVWQVDIEAVVETCRPERVIGRYVGVVRDFDDGGGTTGSATISIFVPERALGMGILPRPERFATAHLAYGIPGQGEGCITGGHARDLLITRAEPDVIEMTVTDDWTNLIGCDEGSVAPNGDCHTERSLSYSLLEECVAPCAIVATGEDPPLMCDCNPMEGT
jgi:hypothetical protein